MPRFLPGLDPLVVGTSDVLHCMRSFPKGTSCGRDGLRAQHLLDSLCGVDSPVAHDLLCAISRVVNIWLMGRCPSVLAEFIASAPLTPLLKPDGGIRPIAVGTVWRRLVSKLAMLKVGKDMAVHLSDFQFGVGIECGAEAILHAVERFVRVNGKEEGLSMLLVDFKNAFNLIDRSSMLHETRARCASISRWVDFCYSQPARLYIGDSFIWSSRGIQQGDPLGPLLFALTLHPLIHKIQESCVLKVQAWYLDDGTLIGDTLEVSKALELIRRFGPDIGLELNVDKTELFWPSPDPRGLQEGVFPSDICRPSKGVKLLGGAVSCDADFVYDLVHRRVSKAVGIMGALAQLKDPQCELLLLRSCLGLSKLQFALRTVAPQLLGECVVGFDLALRRSVDNIVTGEGPGFGDLQWRVASLPIRSGGLGIYAAADTAHFAFIASRAQSALLQDRILRHCGVVTRGDLFMDACVCAGSVIPGLDSVTFSDASLAPPKPMKFLAGLYFDNVCKNLSSDFTLTARQSAILDCTSASHASDFLLAIPIEGLGQRMSPVEYRAVLGYRLMIPLFREGSVCSVCRSTKMDVFGDHAVHCQKKPGFKFRHDLVRDVLFDILIRAGVPARKEAPVNFLTLVGEARPTLRPADVLIYSWVRGRHACVDLTGVSPFVNFGTGVFTVGRAAVKAAEDKVSKHGKACEDNQHAFVPFAFDTFGFLADDAVELIRRIQKVVNQNVANLGAMEYIFRRIGFAIQKGVAGQLVARLPVSFV